MIVLADRIRRRGPVLSVVGHRLRHRDGRFRLSRSFWLTFACLP
jgi:hypothetical protein